MKKETKYPVEVARRDVENVSVYCSIIIIWVSPDAPEVDPVNAVTNALSYTINATFHVQVAA